MSELNEQQKDLAINQLIYGCWVHKLCSKKFFLHLRFFYICEDQLNILYYFPSKKSEHNNFQLDLQKLKYVSEFLDFDKYKGDNVTVKKEQCLSLGFETKIINLVFENAQKKVLWEAGLNHFLSLRHSSHIFAQQIFESGNNDGDESLDLDEIQGVLKSLHVNLNKEILQSLIKQYDTDGNNKLDKEEFRNFLYRITHKKELETIFQFYSQYKLEPANYDKPLMTIFQLIQFYNNEQLQNLDLEKLRQKLLAQIESLNQQPQQINKRNRIFDRLNDLQKDNQNKLNESILLEMHKPVISFTFFQNLIFDIENIAIDASKMQAHDLSKPMTDYYINSSHNTYLSSNQLTGESSVQSYINALSQGCKCIELDCWDGPHDQPIVYHGHTMTSKILFEDTLKAIEKFGFMVNNLPVILSIELHCSKHQQDELARIMNEILGNKLYILPVNWQQQQTYPSPKDLQGKFIVKCGGSIQQAARYLFKNQTFILEEEEQYDNDFDDDLEEDEKVDMKEPSIQIVRESSISRESSFKQGMKCSVERQGVRLEDHFSGKQTEKLSACVTMFGTKYKKETVQSIWNVCSINENKLHKIIKGGFEEIRKCTKKQFIRVYPSGTRVDSSNYDPIPAYLTGAQLIALNYQTNDINKLINMTKFQVAGDTGYYLKPIYLRPGTQTIQPFHPTIKITLSIISGSLLSSYDKKQNRDGNFDSYVQITVKGNPIDETVMKTRIIQSNGMSPQYNHKFEIPICDIEQAFLLFQVFELNLLKKDEQIGVNCLSPMILRQGYRVIPLRKKNLEIIEYSFLFVHIKFD